MTRTSASGTETRTGSAGVAIKRRTTCRYCGSTQLLPVVSLGDQPPSNSFIRPEQIGQEARYPLDVFLCADCVLVQLLDVVPAELIFDEYLYLSSTSRALTRHYEALTRQLAETYSVASGDVVVDIGCNDGALLSGYSTPGVRRVGVEPSRVAQMARERGIEVFQTFFTKDTARDVVTQCGRAKVVTATNVFPHVDDIAAFTDGVPELLRDDGVFVIEASYLIDLVDQLLFDTIYHEHLCYVSVTAVDAFLRRHDLEVIDAVREPIGASGPAIRIVAQKSGGSRPRNASVDAMLAEEKAWGVHEIGRYAAFADRVRAVQTELPAMIRRLKAKGARIGGYGAPAKGNTLLNYAGIGPDLVERIAETNTLKQGLLTPGSHIPIVSEEAFIEWMPDYALLLAWNYLDFLLEKSDYIRKGGRFIVPLPAPRIVP